MDRTKELCCSLPDDIFEDAALARANFYGIATLQKLAWDCARKDGSSYAQQPGGIFARPGGVDVGRSRFNAQELLTWRTLALGGTRMTAKGDAPLGDLQGPRNFRHASIAPLNPRFFPLPAKHCQDRNIS